MADTGSALKHTPLDATHRQAGARMVAFAGWEMPLQYGGILDEHRAVRERVGLFDISHMGRLLVAGPQAERVLDHLLTNDLRRLAVGQSQYSLLCNDRGGIIDDLFVFRLEPTVYLLVVNAANTDVDFAWISSEATAMVVLDNYTDRLASLALQGPNAAQGPELPADLGRWHLRRQPVFGKSCWVSRTGYTGEDGFEIFCEAADAVALWGALLDWGAPLGIQPCGLGARDMLRTEMAYVLHGAEIDEDTSPLAAGLERFVAFDKGEFVGRDALLDQRQKGVTRKLIAFIMTDRSPPPRPHQAIKENGCKVGETTSGTVSPGRGRGIGLGYVEANAAGAETALAIEIRGHDYPAVVRPRPILRKHLRPGESTT
jgi:aminomethyltransferase